MTDDLDPLAKLARAYLASIQVNRMTFFGWEEHVNDFSPEMLRYIADQMPSHRALLLMSADQREATV